MKANLRNNIITMTTKENKSLVLKIKELTKCFKTINMVKQKHNCCMNKQPSYEEKYNSVGRIPKDVYTEINDFLLWPKNKKPPLKEVTKKEEPIQNFKNEYTKEMLMLEKKIFTFPERVAILIEKSFQFSFVLKEYGVIYCFCCDQKLSDNLQKFYEHIRCPKHNSCFKEMIKGTNCFSLANRFMKEVSNNQVICYGCGVLLNNNPKVLQEHSKGKLHTEKTFQLRKHSNNQYKHLLKTFENYCYNIQLYGCIPCNLKFQFKFEFLQHIEQVHKKEPDIMYDFCIPCATLWVVYEDKNSYSYSIHCDNIMHKYLVNNLDFMVDEMPRPVKDLLSCVGKTTEKLFKLSENIYKNDTMQKELLQSLKSSLNHQFPKLKIFQFGSRLTGLGFPSSDIDIFLDCDGERYERSDVSSLVYNYLDVVKNSLYKDEDIWIVQEILKWTRTPIIKLIHRQTGLQCDISFTNGLSVENTKLIRTFNEACPPCRKLILFLKKWLSSCGLPGRHSIKNYALTWLVIFYLQKSKLLPSIDTLIKQKNKSRLISGWETGVDFTIPAISVDVPFTKLLMGFFNFYGDFNYKDHVACPLIGDIVEKVDFIDISNLPKSMSPYIRYIKESCNSGMYRIDSVMCIQDPFDLSHNLTKAVQPLTITAFKKYCKDSADILRNI